MIKLHCDVCDAVITDDEKRVIFKYYPNQSGIYIYDAKKAIGLEPKLPVDVIICGNCLPHYTLADIVKRFERKKF